MDAPCTHLGSSIEGVEFFAFFISKHTLVEPRVFGLMQSR